MNDDSGPGSHPSSVRGTLPQPPRYDRWPASLQQAMRLRGALLRCGPGSRGVGWPATATVRLTALAPWLDDERLIASHLTAAWVWGVARDPGAMLSIATLAGQHTLAASATRIRRPELRLADGDTTMLGGLRVTSPRRTALDLLHDPEPFGTAQRVAYRLLLPLIPGGAPALRAHLSTHRRPHVRLARARTLDSAQDISEGASRRYGD